MVEPVTVGYFESSAENACDAGIGGRGYLYKERRGVPHPRGLSHMFLFARHGLNHLEDTPRTLVTVDNLKPRLFDV